jgi:hypothetical protein
MATGSDSQSAYLVSDYDWWDNTPAYLLGATPVTDSQIAYIYGGAGNTDSVPAYTEGVSEYASSVYAYLSGNVGSSQAAYLEGVRKTTNGTEIVIIGGVLYG